LDTTILVEPRPTVPCYWTNGPKNTDYNDSRVRVQARLAKVSADVPYFACHT